MEILIVQSDPALGAIWARALERAGVSIRCAFSQRQAVTAMQTGAVDLIVLAIDLREGSPIAVADFAAWRYPKAKIITVTSRTFFSDGSVFSHIPNACSLITAETPPEDLAALVDHYGEQAAEATH